MSSPPVFRWFPYCSSFQFFVLSYYVFLRTGFRVAISVMISRLKRCSVRHYLQLFVGGSCLIYFICVGLRIVVYNTYCVVFCVMVGLVLCAQYCCFSLCAQYCCFSLCAQYCCFSLCAQYCCFSGLSILACPFSFL